MTFLSNLRHGLHFFNSDTSFKLSKTCFHIVWAALGMCSVATIFHSAWLLLGAVVYATIVAVSAVEKALR